jgi:hypothetical protein
MDFTAEAYQVSHGGLDAEGAVVTDVTSADAAISR